MQALRPTRYADPVMPFPKRVCVECEQEFELKPDKPGLANRCPQCSVAPPEEPGAARRKDAEERRGDSEANAERRKAIRELLYRKDG